MKGRLLGPDPGERRVGVDVSDVTRTIASPVEYIDRDVGGHDQRLTDLCTEWEITEIVVGLPVSLDGSEGEAAERARSYGERVRSLTGFAVEYHDERFTTVTAEHALLEGGMKRKARTSMRDQVAASVMLQGHLDRRRYAAGERNDEDA